MNEYDTEPVRSIWAKENYTFVPDEMGADIIMLNTCAMRGHAHRKVYGRVHA
jgi:tRNA-2-methylthio-N6-dimethylallyladenosine synthase